MNFIELTRDFHLVISKSQLEIVKDIIVIKTRELSKIFAVSFSKKTDLFINSLFNIFFEIK